ncbi:MAG: FxLYD domain-containing protein [Eubacteriales bacterium]|nr:FxLYD domain-containing protein [Eubacteriales bacterium]
MFCRNCGSEYEGKFCPNCGAPADTPPANPGQPPKVSSSMTAPERDPEYTADRKTSSRKKKKKKGILIPILIVVGLLLCFSLFSGSNSNSSSSQTKAEPSAETETEPDNEKLLSPDSPEDTAPAKVQKAPEKVVDYSVKQEYFYDYVNSLGSHTASAFVEIENTGNTSLYLSDGKFDIEDDAGHLLKSESMISTCPNAIRPGETGYFYATYIDLDDVDTSNGMNFAPHYKVEEAKHEIIDYQTSDTDIREDDFFTCKITGRLTNTSDEKISLTYVNAVYYDADGNVIGISGTNLSDIEPGDTESFEIIGQFFRDNVSYSDIAQYKLIPRAWYLQF